MLRLEEGWSIRKTIDMAGRDIAKKNLNRLIKKNPAGSFGLCTYKN